MNVNKRIIDIYKVGKSLVDKERNFNKNYKKLYDGHKNIYKDHYVLRHAFNILDYVKKENNEIDPKEYLEEDRKEKYKFNIFNYQTALKPDKSKKLYSLDDELLKILLLKINRKNIEEQKKRNEEKRNFQSLSLKGIRKKNSFIKTFNTNKSMKSYNNISSCSGYKSINSSNFNTSSKILNRKNIFSYNIIDNSKKCFKNYESPTNFYYNDLNNRLKDIFQNINSEEKNMLIKSNSIKNDFKRMLKTNYKNKFDSKTINSYTIRKSRVIIKYPERIKKKKDLENILFKDYDLTFNKVKNKLRTIYKYPKLKIDIN